MRVVTPNDLFALSPIHIALHVLLVAAIVSLLGALILRFALKKGAKVEMSYGKAYALNLLMTFVIVFAEAMFVYKIVHYTVLSPSDFIGPGNWFPILLSNLFAMTIGTIVMGFVVKRVDGRRIGTTASLAAALIYSLIFNPLALSARVLYFWVLQNQGLLGA